MNKNISFILILSMLFWVQHLTQNTLLAQEADDYDFKTNTNSSFVDMSNSTLLLDKDLVLQSSSVVSLDFEMWFMGIRYTDFSVNTNGVIQLGKNPIIASANAYNIANAPRIAAFTSGSRVPVNGDWKIAPNGKIHYKTIGTSPNRIVVIEATNLLINETVTDFTATFQIWLYETPPLLTNQITNPNSGKIEFRYATMQCGLNTINTVRIGIGSDGAKNKFKGVDFVTIPPVAKISDNEISNVINKGNIPNLHSADANNLRIFSFESPIPNGQATNLKGTSPTGTEVVLNWEKAGTNIVGSVIYKSTNSKDFTFLTQVNDGTTFTDKDVKPCVTYYYRVYTVTEGKLGTLQTSANLTYQISVPLTIDIKGTLFSCATNPSSVKPIEAVDSKMSFEKFFWVDSKKDTVGRNATFSPPNAGSYLVVGKTKDGCTATKDFVVIECCEVELVIPTAFTPFNTPVNNTFFVKAENTILFNLRIFNRWGIEVFNANNPNLGWNGGFYNGNPMQAGAYQVVVEYSGCKDGRTINETAMAVLYLIE